MRGKMVGFPAMRTTTALLALSFCLAGSAACGPAPAPSKSETTAAHAPAPLEELLQRWPAEPALVSEGEKHFGSVRQITFGGENAEAYWSPDGRSLIFQATPREEMSDGCDQEYVLDLETGTKHRVSTGQGKTTCGYFLPGTNEILYSSTHLAAPGCPPPPDRSRGYVWKLNDGFDIFLAGRDGSNLRRLTDTPGYDAEATLREDGGRILFTSLRSGDLDIWSMKPDGSDLRQITSTLGYEGGPFYSPDGARIVYRSHLPVTDEEITDYKALISERLIRPIRLEIFVMDADGSNNLQLTDNGKANFAPSWFRNGQRIIFSSNMADPGGRDFDLWAIDDDGENLERITTNDTFDGFPMFSPDGKWLVFCSNRHNENPHETNVFIAEWVD